MKAKFICIHIGARAHYLIPQALVNSNRLSLLVTDTWIGSSFVRRILKKVPVRVVQSFANRYNNVLKHVSVASATAYFFVIELILRKRNKHGWPLIIARNQVFQKWAKGIVAKTSPEYNLFAISYTALEIFKAPFSAQRKKVLFQIDPGIEEEYIVSKVTEQYASLYPTVWEKAPDGYWKSWLEECRLSDSILVNSAWSKEGLLKQGIAEHKIHILPLPYEVEKKHINFKRSYPSQFNSDRPLVCLFLGTLTLRKGIHMVLAAAHQLRDKPVQFVLVGNNELSIDLNTLPNISYKGVCSREETDEWYKKADVFLFPTLSDGFGLTQLEAMAWSVPVVASTFCGSVVTDTVNGNVLKECTAEELSRIIESYLVSPEMLQTYSEKCVETVREYSIENFSMGLEKLL